MLKAAKEESEDSPFWHSTFLFQLADLYRSLGELVSFHSTLARGVKYCEKSCAPVAQLYFMLMQFLHFNLEFKYKEAAAVSADLFSRLDKLQHPACTILKASHHTISLLSGLQLGKILTYKGQLKELQLFAREISHSNTPESDSSPSPDNFIWIQRDNLFQLVYLISMLHPMLSGATDRAIGYADKALRLISQQTEILLDQPWDGFSGDNIPQTLADQFKSLVLHNLCVCYIVKGSLTEVPPLLQQTEALHTRSIDPLTHHMLTGLYLFGQDRYKLALSHFHLALDTPGTCAPSQDVFLQVQALIHICICYVKLGSQYYDSDAMTQTMSRLKTMRNNQLPPEALNLNAATNFVIGLHQALLQSLPEAKSALKEAVVLANTEDLHKLVACTLILLGKVFMAIGKREEAGTMIPPAYQLANKIQDMDLQIWASTLMAEFLQSAGDEELHRETLSIRQMKLAKRDLELKQVQGLEDGSISMVGWVDGTERQVGSQENALPECGTKVLMSPRSPDPKRVCVGHPLTPLTEDNKTENFVIKQEITEVEIKAKHGPDSFTRQETPNQLNTQDTSTDTKAYNHLMPEPANSPDTDKELSSSQCDQTPMGLANSIPNNAYGAVPHMDHTPPMNGTSHPYQKYLEEPVYNSPLFPQTTPLNMTSESPLKHSVRLSQQDNIIYQEPRNLPPQLPTDPTYQLGGRLTNQGGLPSDIPINRSYYQQPNEASRYQPGALYQQVLSQGNSHPSPHYSPHNRGIRLLDQGDWTGEENEISVPIQQHMPLVHPLLAENPAARYQQLQQLARHTALLRQQNSEISAASGDTLQNIQIPLEALASNRYRQNMLDLTGQNVSLDSFQSRQVPAEPMQDQVYLRQPAFDMEPNMEPRLPAINPVPSRQPFKLQNLLQSAPINAISPDKLAQPHNKRLRISPPSSHAVDPLSLPTSSYNAKPIGMPQGLLNPLMLQSYPQQPQSSPCRQQQGMQLNPALHSLYSKNLSQSFGQYFIPRAPYIFPSGGVYPPSQYQSIDPSRLQMHPQTREK